MANNVAITAGAGTNIATDDVASVHYQVVKLAVGTEDAADRISSTNPMPVSFDGTVSSSHLVSAATTNPTVVKAAAGTLKGVTLFSVAATPLYVKFHNQATAPTAGTGVVLSFGIQAGTPVHFPIPDGGRAFSTGIAFTTVTGMADASTTAIGANELLIEVWYE